MIIKKYVYGLLFILTILALFFIKDAQSATLLPKNKLKTKQHIIYPSTRKSINSSIEKFKNNYGSGFNIIKSRSTGIASHIFLKDNITSYFLNSSSKKSLGTIQVIKKKKINSELIAKIFFKEYGSIFGIKTPDKEMLIKNISKIDEVGGRHIKFQQYYRKIPVIAGEMIVHLDSNNNITMVNGEYLPDIEVDTIPILSKNEAMDIVYKKVLPYYSVDDFEIKQPKLRIFNLGLFRDIMEKTYLVWEVQIEGISLDNRFLKEKYYIDAHNEKIIFHFSDNQAILQREIYDFSPDDDWYLARHEGTTDLEANEDVNNAYDYAKETYDYFFNTHGRESIDGAGMPMIIHVNYQYNCPNAFWTGKSVYFCSGMVSRDLLAHEVTHGLIQFTSNLHYFFQGGALQESYGDIFGSAIDKNWIIGEEAITGPFRDISNPVKFDHPDKTSSDYYSCYQTNNDAGGVHINSGVPNKAAYLMAAGTEDNETFNGYSIKGIGRTKMEKIQYRALTTKLLSGSDFRDNYFAIKSSCNELIGTYNITNNDCLQVEKALDAVEMDQLPKKCSPYPEEISNNFCPEDMKKADVWNDDFENIDIGNWEVNRLSGEESYWSFTPILEGKNSTSGENNLYADTYHNAIVDDSIEMTKQVLIRSNTYLQFNQSYMFGNINQGGVLEYSSVDGLWDDLGSLALINGYNKKILNINNPLNNRSAFTSDSYGYHTTRIDLNSLSGDKIKIRFRVGTSGEKTYGWFLDDISFFRCLTPLNNIKNMEIPPANISISKGLKNPEEKTVKSGALNVTILQFSVTAEDSSIDINELNFTASGTGNEQEDIKAVKLFKDSNSNGKIDWGDVLIATENYNFDNDTITFRDLSIDVYRGDSLNLLLAYDFALKIRFSNYIEKDFFSISRAYGYNGEDSSINYNSKIDILMVLFFIAIYLGVCKYKNLNFFLAILFVAYFIIFPACSGQKMDEEKAPDLPFYLIKLNKISISTPDFIDFYIYADDISGGIVFVK